MFEQIVNFFFQNMFFFIILLFGLSQLFRRKTSNDARDRENRPKQNPLPPVAKPFFEEWLEPQKHENKKEVSEKTRKVEEYVDELDEHVPVPSFEQEEIQTYSPPLQTITAEPNERTIQVRDDGVKIKSKTFQNPSRREVAQGIMWAEILGPPRAKKKYTYRRY